MNKVFSKSENFRSEYCISVVEIGEVFPIEGKDKIGYTIVNGETIVVRKDSTQKGDVLFYASNETQLNSRFLSKNNQFNSGYYELNDNHDEIASLKEKNDEASNAIIREKIGYFNANCRVSAVRLGGIKSKGFLFNLEFLQKCYPEITKDDVVVGEDFDMINGEIFVKPYIPSTNRDKKTVSKTRKNKDFNRIIDGQFAFHYDTSPLPKCIKYISPDSDITVSIKYHGTSFICGKLKVKLPIKLPIIQRLKNFIIDRTGLFTNYRTKDYEIGYGNITSSRKVIKNKYINKKSNGGYYGTDDYMEMGNFIYPYLDEGMTVYGEIVGWCSNGSKMFQKGYDYGCAQGENKLIIYRITTKDENGVDVEWEVSDVRNWVVNLIKKYPSLSPRLYPIDILYQGKFYNLYPEISVTDNDWAMKTLEAMRSDKKRFGLEKNEPLCTFNKVPREGVVVRVGGPLNKQAFKLKAEKFFDFEKKRIDNGEVDMEMEQ